MTKPGSKNVDNLGKRHRVHNDKVNEAAGNKVDFNEVKEYTENSDLDKLFKIDLAAKYRNVDYIIDVLKSADGLFTTRALKKCSWLFTDEYSNFMNPEYLHAKVFPFTSLKMKRKILTTLSMHVRNEERAAKFYSYCMETKLINMAFKFFRFTSQEFKLELIKNHNCAPFNEILQKDIGYWKKIIGKSFALLEAYLEMLKSHSILRQFRYFYAVSNNRYLDLIEKYWTADMYKLDSELCNEIMQKYKSRVLSNPLFYIKILDNFILSKYTTPEDAKMYAVAVLPSKAIEFWWYSYYQTYEYFLKHIPHEETYAFLKHIFQDHYADTDFEMDKYFFDQHYYKFMTIEEQEEWAWNHIKSEKQILGVGNDYKWYRFINFQDAFETVRKNIIVTKEPDRRSDMIGVLVESARTNNELTTLLEYYHKRHVNEIRNFKDKFLYKVISHHNVFEFDENSWKAFYTLLQSMEIYNTLDLDFQYEKKTYKDVALIYHIVHSIEIPDVLVLYMTDEFVVGSISHYYQKLDEKKKYTLFETLYTFYMDLILKYKNVMFNSQVESRSRRYFQQIISLMSIFHKEDKNICKTKKPMKSKKPRHTYTELSDRGLLYRLKKDTNLVLSTFPDVQSRFDATPFKIKNFLKKLRVYFPNDLINVYLELFVDNVARELNAKAIEAAVYGIFELADQKYKVDFMNEHAPEDTKIDCSEVDAKKLRIRRAICRFACCSRPPVPLANIRMYIKGDYVKNCLHIFNMFLANLSLPMCLQFVESIINSPVSVQKHAIRLAFQCFNTNALKNLIIKIWRQTKNVSLRGVIYKALFDKVKSDEERDLYEALKEFTLDLHQDDEDAIFALLVSNELKEEFLGDYNEAAWLTVRKLKDIEPHIQRKISVICNIHDQMYLMKEEFVRSMIDEHITTVFIEKKLDLFYANEKIKPLLREIRNLLATYNVYFISTKGTPEKYADLTKFIVLKCVELWNEKYINTFIYREYCTRFISELKCESSTISGVNYENTVPIFQACINALLSSLPLYEVYLKIWDLRLTILNKNIIQKGRLKLTEVNSADVLNEAAVVFGREVGKVVVEFIENDQYFSALSKDIKDVVYNNASDLFKNIYEQYYRCREEYLVSVARGLLEYKLAETYTLAVLLLPNDCESVTCKEVLEEIRSLLNTEVQCALYHKFKMINYTANKS